MGRPLPSAAEVSRRQRRMSRWRAFALVAIYALFVVHYVQWKLAGTTVAPFELNEAMYTIEEGVITVGALFLLAIMVSVLFFGRFFCGWLCHILALQDAASWLLAKVHIRAKPIRSRLLPLIAIGALLYMFVWPTLLRLLAGDPFPGFRVLSDQQGLGSFTTGDLMRNLPGPIMTAITFVVCGGVVVWLLGSRAFCRYVCPYGALFALVNRVSPASIKLVGTCNGCGQCTAACTSHIRVHHEIQVHGKVVTAGCLKDLDCVMSCPQNAIVWGWSKPSPGKSFDTFLRPSVRWAWTWPEELLGTAAFFAGFFATRGLYGEVPFLLALTIGLVVAWAFVTTVRLWRRPNVRVGRWQLRRGGIYGPSAAIWMLIVTLGAGLLAHSGWIRWHEVRGQAAWQEAMLQPDAEHVSIAAGHLEVVAWSGLYRPAYADRMLADLWLRGGRPDLAIPYLERLLHRWPDHGQRQRQLEAARAALLQRGSSE